jgi:hypothetical protein
MEFEVGGQSSFVDRDRPRLDTYRALPVSLPA